MASAAELAAQFSENVDIPQNLSTARIPIHSGVFWQVFLRMKRKKKKFLLIKNRKKCELKIEKSGFKADWS